MHMFTDDKMRAVMQTHIDEINRMEQDQIDGLNSTLPFKSGAAKGRP